MQVKYQMSRVAWDLWPRGGKRTPWPSQALVPAGPRPAAAQRRLPPSDGERLSQPPSPISRLRCRPSPRPSCGQAPRITVVLFMLLRARLWSCDCDQDGWMPISLTVNVRGEDAPGSCPQRPLGVPGPTAAWGSLPPLRWPWRPLPAPSPPEFWAGQAVHSLSLPGRGGPHSSPEVFKGLRAQHVLPKKLPTDPALTVAGGRGWPGEGSRAQTRERLSRPSRGGGHTCPHTCCLPASSLLPGPARWLRHAGQPERGVEPAGRRGSRS